MCWASLCERFVVTPPLDEGYQIWSPQPIRSTQESHRVLQVTNDSHTGLGLVDLVQEDSKPGGLNHSRPVRRVEKEKKPVGGFRQRNANVIGRFVARGSSPFLRPGFSSRSLLDADADADAGAAACAKEIFLLGGKVLGLCLLTVCPSRRSRRGRGFRLGSTRKTWNGALRRRRSG